jgi:hypothetical protein
MVRNTAVRHVLTPRRRQDAKGTLREEHQRGYWRPRAITRLRTNPGSCSSFVPATSRPCPPFPPRCSMVRRGRRFKSVRGLCVPADQLLLLPRLATVLGLDSTERPPRAAIASAAAEDPGCRYGRHRRLDGEDRPRTDPRQLARTHALPVRKGQEGQERLRRDVRDLLAAPDRGRQAARGRRYPGVPARNDQARPRTSTGDNHHPLYTFVKDKRKGQTNGEA